MDSKKCDSSPILGLPQYSPLMLLILLYKAVPTFESVGEIQKCEHLNSTFLYKVVLTLMSVDEILKIPKE